MNKTILGIDLGVSSCGWCLIERNDKGEVVKFVDAGVRIFNSPVEAKEQKLKNAKRREKRLARRNNVRKNRRTKKLINLLFKNNFISPNYINKKDHIVELNHLINQDLGDPFDIREKAIYQKVSKDEFAYAIIHLSRRRGFNSSKKSLTDQDKKELAEASEISQEMKKMGCRTIGEYLNKNGNKNNERKRNKYLLRALIENELIEIINVQRSLGMNITEELENELREIIFFQRPLKLQKDKIGYCTFEARKRTTKFHPDAQKFEIYQRIKNLRLIEDITDNKTGRMLSNKECHVLFDVLMTKKEMSFKDIKKILNIKEDAIFNFEKNNEKFKGNEILNMFKKETIKDYLNLSEEEKENLLTNMFTIFDLDARERVLRKKWASKFNKEEFESEIINNKTTPKYLNLSLRTCKRLFNEMYNNPNIDLDKAKRKIYPKFFSEKENQEKNIKENDFILRFDTTKNPTVDKAVNQARKIINEIIKTYGKPDQVNIELARDLKNSKKQKDKIDKINRKRSEEKKGYKEEISNLIGKNFDSLPLNQQRDLMDKIKLYNEPKNKGQLIYPIKTNNGYEISKEAINLYDLLIDSENKYEIDHIIPRSISMDDRLSNKIISLKKQNQFKSNKTPFEIWGSDNNFYNNYFKFIKEQIPHKIKSFEISKQDYMLQNGFNSRQLNDTRYMSKFLKDQLIPYFENVSTIKGGLTSLIRRMIGFENKNRNNHLHHIEDAFIIAFSTEKTIKAAYNNLKSNKELFKPLIKNEVLKSFKDNLEKVIVSYEKNKNIGEILKDTKYGKRIIIDDNKVLKENNKTMNLKNKESFYVYKVALSSLKKSQIKNVFDQNIKHIINEYLKKNPPSKKDAPLSNVEFLPHPNGTFIRKVRVRKNSGKTFKKENKEKNMHQYFLSSGNHHLDIYQNKMDGKICVNMVTRIEQKVKEVYKKIDNKILNSNLSDLYKVIIEKENNLRKNNEFLFSLSINDIVKYENDYYRIQILSIDKNNNIKIIIRKAISSTSEVSSNVKNEYVQLSKNKINKIEKIKVNILGYEK